MSMAFIDYRCSECNGVGYIGDNEDSVCPKCNGTGCVGAYKEVPNVYISENGGMEDLRNARVSRNVGLRDLGAILDIKPSRLSELELGINGAFPTQEEQNKISNWIRN